MTMATEIKDASGALIGHQLEHTAQQVDDAVEGVDDLTQRVKRLEDQGTGVDPDEVTALIAQYIADNHITGVSSEEIQKMVDAYMQGDAIEQSVQDWLDSHPEATTTVEDGSLDAVKLSDSLAEKLGIRNGGTILGDTEQTEGAESFAAMFQKAKNEVMYEYMGDINKIPLIVHTDQHGALNGSSDVKDIFETIDRLVNWQDISKIINLGDCVAQAWKDVDTDHPGLQCAELDKMLQSVEPIPLNKQLNVFGNHDQFTWDSENNKYGPSMTNQACLQRYFRNLQAHRRSNNGWFTVEDGYFNVKYVVTSAYEGTSKIASTEQIDFLISELGKNDGYDIILIAHELYNPAYDSRVFPTTSDMAWKGSAENDNNYGMGVNVNSILVARKNKGSGTMTDASGVLHEFDFSSCKTDLICSIHGHTHYDTYNYVDDCYLNFALSPMCHSRRWIFFLLIDRAGGALKVWKLPTKAPFYYEKYKTPLSVEGVETYTVKSRLINTTAFNASTQIKYGLPYSQFVKAKKGYTLGFVKVLMDGSDVTSTAYDSDTQLIHINAVTGVIDLTAYDSTIDSSKTIFVATEHYDQDKTARNDYTGTVIEEGGTYKVGFFPKSGYRIDDVEVLMDGVDVTSTAYNGTTTILIDSVTGDVDVSVAVAPITITNEYVEDDGSVASAEKVVLSGYESVDGYDSIDVAWSMQGGTRYVALYDANKDYIGKVNGINSGSSTNNPVYIGSNTKYVRFGATNMSNAPQYYFIRKSTGATYATVTVTAPETIGVVGVSNNVKYGDFLSLGLTNLSGYDDADIIATVTVGGSPLMTGEKVTNGNLSVPYVDGDVTIELQLVRPLAFEISADTAFDASAGGAIDTGVAPMSSRDKAFTVCVDYTPNTPGNQTAVFANLGWQNAAIFAGKYSGKTFVWYAGVSKSVDLDPNTTRVQMVVTHDSGSLATKWWITAASLAAPLEFELTNTGGSAAGRTVQAANIYVGGSSTGDHLWKGTVHNFQIWNKVLSDAEIRAYLGRNDA